MTTRGLEAWLVTKLASMLGLEARSIDVRQRFSRLGLDSLGAVRLVAALSQHLGRSLPPTLIYERPTIEALARWLAGGSEPVASFRVERPESTEPIAIVGLSCRFPRADDEHGYWRLLRDGVDAVSEVPEERGWSAILESLDPGERAKVRRGAFLEQVDGFDSLAFGISPREAAAIDPQQRLMLELCHEALEDAGIRASSLRGSRTGVYAGAIWKDYGSTALRAGAPSLGPFSVTGVHHSIIANRVSYIFGLEGPSLTLDSACSSGLVVIHLACQSLLRGESEVALAGAVSLNLLAESALGVARFGALSPDGRCFTFDARANGYVRGEGGGVVVLERLSRAIAAGDRIRAVIRGSAVNNDGATNGLTAPSRAAQETLLRTAYASAEISPYSVQYVELHGTGTPLGDPIEARALGAALGAGRPDDAPLLVGSVKTNMGHLEGAAGVAGLIKTVLTIEQRQLVPSLNFERENPVAPLGELGLAVTTARRAWPEPEQRLVAGVSSFGLGGTNAHVVLEEWLGPKADLLPIAASDTSELRQRAEALRAEISTADNIHAVCRRARAQSHAGRERLAIVETSPLGFERALSTWLEGGTAPELHHHPKGAVDCGRGVVFVFPGQGAQWIGMARSMLDGEPVFRSMLERCDRLVERELGWSLLEELAAPALRSRLDRIDVSLPAVISIDIAIAEWWRSMGIEPSAVVGHSTGEIAAAYVAGALDLEDTIKVICAYGRSIAKNAGRGAMALVGLGWDDATSAIRDMGVWPAIEDSANATVIAGEPLAIEGALTALSARGVFCRRVAMNVAPHCPLADPLLDELFEALRDIRPRSASVPLVSEVTGAEVPGESLDAAHWVRNFGERVHFSRAVDTLIARGHRIFVDVGPQPITRHSIETNLKRADATGVVLGSMRRDEDDRRVALDSLAELFALGLPVQFTRHRPDARLLMLSAKSPEALVALASRHAESLVRDGAALYDYARALCVERDHHEHRVALVEETPESAAAALRAFAEQGALPRLRAAGRPRVVFVFPGQGSQWLGMGRQLLAREQVFREAIEACDAAIARIVGLSVLDELRAEADHSRLADIDVVQPTLFAIEVALAALFRSYGIEPDAVVGHSMGEVAAAHVAGILDLDDAARVIAVRSAKMRRLRGSGGMALVELSVADAERAIERHRDRLSVAVSNGPRSTVIAGDVAALDQLLADLEGRHVFCRRVRVDVASHSPQMDVLRHELLAELATVRPKAARTAMRSTVTGEWVDGTELDGDYWVRNLRQPVMFSAAVQSLVAEGHRVFLELSPHPILLPSISENLAALGEEGVVVPSMRRDLDERRVLLEGLGALYVAGLDPDARVLFPERGERVSLPKYAWQRERHWLEPAAASRPSAQRTGHPLLGTPLVPADRTDARYWEQQIDARTPSYLQDHRVHDAVVFPGAGYVEMMLSSAEQVLGANPFELASIEFIQVLALATDERRDLQLVHATGTGGEATLTIASRASGDDWTSHATARLIAGRGAPSAGESIAATRARCPRVLEIDAFHARLAERGLRYGDAFRGLRELHLGSHEVLARVELPEALATAEYAIHPALLDACMQASLALLPDEAGTFVPTRIEMVRRLLPVASRAWAHLRMVAGETDRPPKFDVRILSDEGQLLFELRGLALAELDARRSVGALEECLAGVEYVRRELGTIEPSPRPGRWVVLCDEGGFGDRLAEVLAHEGGPVVKVRNAPEWSSDGHTVALDPCDATHLERLFGQVLSGVPLLGVVHLGNLDATPISQTTSESLRRDIARGTLGAVRVAQAIARQAFRDPPRLVIVTRGAVPADQSSVSIAQAPVLGLGRTLAIEHPELECACIDLPLHPTADEVSRLVRELFARDREDRIALRADGRHVARLARTVVEQSTSEGKEPTFGRPYRLEAIEPGVLEGLGFRVLSRRAPDAGEVEIEVEVAGLNFRDVLQALGAHPGPETAHLGSECEGRIVAIGAGVTHLRVGQRVVAWTQGAFASHVTTSAALVAPYPMGLSAAQAATIPIVFATAHYALRTIGRVAPGERVLVHSASGGTGLAAIQVARSLGAELYATAGSEEKRAFLRALGVSLVMDSRSLAFGDEILSHTNGRGVDVVLNSLAGDAITRSLEILAPFGRFLEIGKKDIYENRRIGLLPFRDNVSYSAIDLAGLAAARPDRAGALLREVLALFEDGTYAPLPIEELPTNAAADGFRKMAQAKHVGKLAIRMNDGNVRVTTSPERSRIVSDATYLLTGGLGGLGLSLARWLVEQGARHLVLVGRSAPSAEVAAELAALEALGAAIDVARCDVSRRTDLEALLSRVRREMPPLRGVVHAAAVLEDRTLLGLEEPQFWAPIAPKVFGAFHLHELTRADALDFFVMYSSVAALLGSPGQPAYSAANAFLDALAHARRAEGLCAMSIQWGPFADVGLAAAQENRGHRLASAGLTSFRPEEGSRLFSELLQHPRTEVGLVRLSVRRWLETYPQISASPFFAQIREREPSPRDGTSPFRDELRRVAPEARRAAIEAHLRDQLGKVLRLDPRRIEPTTPFTTLGVDSLMSLELRNRLETTLGTRLSATLLFTHPNVDKLARHLVELLAPTQSAPVPASPPPTEAVEDDDLLAAFDASARRIKSELLS